MAKKIIGVLLLVLLIVGVVIGIVLYQNREQDSNLQTIKVNEVTRSLFYVPQYAAIANGFFEEEGLKLDLTTSEGTDKVMTAILANQSDIGFAGPEASIYIYNEGKEDYAQIFAQITKRDGSFLVSRENEDFKWENLKGKTIIPGRKGGMPYMTFEYLLKQKGLDTEKEVVLDDSIKFDLMAGAFSGGTADYVTLFEPTASMTEEQGKGYIVASIGEAAGEIPYTTYFAKKSYIENNPEIIEKFTRAVYKGQKWVQEHSAEEIAQAVQDYFPSTDVTMFAKSIQRYKDIDAWNTTPILTEESFNRLQDVMEEAGELKQRVPYDLVVNNSFGEKVSKE